MKIEKEKNERRTKESRETKEVSEKNHYWPKAKMDRLLLNVRGSLVSLTAPPSVF